MSLIKLFNINYLKENLKKSKGFIILFIILVPAFTGLFTVFCLNSEIGVELIEPREISWINLIGMYILPVLLSFSLFGYVYKKTSVDFINSMPLNRKTIFITNTIGGIVLITIMQLLTALVLVLCNIFCAGLTIISGTIFELFVLLWVSYVFVFTATNLAMTISGTFVTQIAVTMLILFLVPFCSCSFSYFGVVEENIIEVDGINDYHVNNNYNINYTLPSELIFDNIFGRYNPSGGNTTESIIKMVILETVYLGLGLVLFSRRKMEDTEESFASANFHLFIKALTMLPFVTLVYYAEGGMAFNVITIAMIIVYYVIYDYIVKRKIAIKRSAVSLVLILVVLFGIVYGQDMLIEKLSLRESKTISKESITQINIASLFEIEKDYFTDNKEIIDYIFENAKDVYNQMVDIDTIQINDENVTNISNDIPIYENVISFNVSFKDVTGKEYYDMLEIGESKINEFLDIISKDEKLTKEIREAYTECDKIKFAGLVLDNETEETVKQEVRNTINNMSLKEIYDFKFDARNRTETRPAKMIDGIAYYNYIDTNANIPDIELYSYQSKYNLYSSLPINVTPKTVEAICKYENKIFKEAIEKQNENPNLDVNSLYMIYNTNEVNYRDYSFYSTIDEAKKLLKEDIEKETNTEAPYCVLQTYIMEIDRNLCYFSNSNDEYEKLLDIEEQYAYREVYK